MVQYDCERSHTPGTAEERLLQKLPSFLAAQTFPVNIGPCQLLSLLSTILFNQQRVKNVANCDLISGFIFARVRNTWDTLGEARQKSTQKHIEKKEASGEGKNLEDPALLITTPVTRSYAVLLW